MARNARLALTLSTLFLVACAADTSGEDDPLDPGKNLPPIGDDDPEPKFDDDDTNPGDDPGEDYCDDPDLVLGAWCEFHEDCCDDQQCIAGRCSLPPEGPCEADEDCPVGFVCTEEGCVCEGDHCGDGECPESPPRLAGSWRFVSRLEVTGALEDYVLARRPAGPSSFSETQ